MGVPSSNSILSAIKLELPDEMKKNNGDVTDALSQMLNDICNSVNGAWSTWASEVKFGGATVSGLGIGTWTGTGIGGSFSKTISMTIPYTYDTDGSKKLIDSLNSRIGAAFNEWINSFTFAGVTYTGTSTATSSSPGTFNATNSPTSLSSSGTIAKFGTLANDMYNDLGFESASIVVDLLSAVQTATTNLFNTWRSSSTITGNSVSGTAASGAGTGSGTSSNDGVIA
jgi:hypothetical protein